MPKVHSTTKCSIPNIDRWYSKKVRLLALPFAFENDTLSSTGVQGGKIDNEVRL